MVTAAIIPFKEPPSLSGLSAQPPALFLPHERAAERFFGFFTVNIRNQKHAAGLLQGSGAVFRME